MIEALIFFAYGLVLFSMGLVLIVESRREFIPRLSPALIALAAFAFVKAAHEWMQMIQRAVQESRVLTLVEIDFALIATIVAAGLLLLAYGLRLLASHRAKWPYLVAALSLLVWMGAAVILQVPGNLERTLVRAETLARYLVFFPACMIAAAGTLRIHALHPEAPAVRLTLQIGAGLFVLYGLFAGLVVPKTTFFPASFLNEDVLGGSSILPSLLRAVVAVGITVAIFRGLRLFELIAARRRDTQNLLEYEADLGARIQSQLVPGRPIEMADLRVTARSRPARSVGGDWYDYFLMKGDLVVGIGDASGKGVPAALLSSVAMATIASELRSQAGLLEVAGRANAQIVDRFGAGGSFATAQYGLLTSDSDNFSFLNFGHEPPLLYRASSKSWEVAKILADLPLGVMMGGSQRIQELEVRAGDKVLFYSDGIHDVRDKEGEFLTTAAIMEWLSTNDHLDADEMLERLIAVAVDHADGDPPDDITLLLLERRVT